jgi:Right handed beta helix region
MPGLWTKRGPVPPLVLATLIGLLASLVEVMSTASGALAGPCSTGRYRLMVSSSSDRSNPSPLCGQDLQGDVYVFIRPQRGLERVRFSLDGVLWHTERRAPWDFAGGSRATALPLHTSDVLPGDHVIRARGLRNDGRRVRISGRFTIEGGGTGSCNGINVDPGRGTLDEVADAAPAGSTFCLPAGTFIVIRPVEAENGDVFVGSGRDATFIEGDGTVRNLFMGGPGAHFTAASLDISGAVANAACAPRCGRAFMPSAGITVRDVRCHHNDSLCIGGGGGPTTVEGSEIDHNGLDQGSWAIEAGGIKRITGTVTIRNTYIHDNGGNGAHCDKCEGALFLVENNVIERNGGTGVSYEISGGFDAADRAIIRNNTIRENGWEQQGGSGGVYVISSQDVEIHGNAFGGNYGGKGVYVYDDSRGFVVRNVSVHDNTLNGDSVQDCSLPGVDCVNNG